MKRSVSIKLVSFVSLALVLGLALWMLVGQPGQLEGESSKSSVVQTAPSTRVSARQAGTPPPTRPLPASTSKLANPQVALARAAVARSNAPTQEQIQRTSRQILDHLAGVQNRAARQATKRMRGLPRGRGQTVPNPKQQQAIDDLLDTLGEDTELQMDNLSGTLRHLRGDLKRLVRQSQKYDEARSRNDYGGMSIALAHEINTVMNIREPAKEFLPEKITEDELGMVHVILQQQFRGAPVWGAEIGVHFNAHKEPIQMSGVYAPTPVGMPKIEEEIAEQTALAKAKEAVGMTGEGLVPPKVQRMVYWDLDRAPVMCYNVDLTPDHAQAWEIFISVADGSVVHRYDKMVYAAAVGQSPDLKGTVRQINCWEDNGVYLAIDTTRPMYDVSSNPTNLNQTKGALYILDFANQNPHDQNIKLDVAKTNNISQWDPAAVSYSHNLTRTLDYYRGIFGRSSFDDKGMNVVSILHFRWGTPDGGSHNDNACWNPNTKALYYGDGDQYDGGIMPHDIDTVAHEYTHGITDFTSNLIYENQSGAINEHFSDFFACMVDRDDWLIGEDTMSVPGKIALRDVQNPGNPDVLSSLPAHMNEFRYMPVDQDHGGVHINMGIPSRMSYLLADGPYGIGREKAERIAYRAQTHYLTQRGQFIDYRRTAISAAKDFHGDGSAEVEAVKRAFDDVGIAEGEATPPSTPGQPTSGEEAALFLVANPLTWDPFRQDYFYALVINVQGQSQLLTPRYVANTRPAASGDGQWGLYVDGTNNIFYTDGESEQQWTQEGIVRTIAMSKNLRYIAFTTIDYANTIYLIDTESQEGFFEVKLSVPVKDAEDADLYFADVMTFNFRGDHLIYDAVSEIKLASGESYLSWGIYGLRLADLNSYLVLPQVPGEQIGNPIFSHTMDHLLLADLEVIDGDQSTNHVIVLDFNQNMIGSLLSNLPVMGRPSFRGDDRKILFRTFDESQSSYLLAESTLASDNLSLQEGSLNVIYSDILPIDYPFGFRVGEYVPQEGKISVPPSVAFGDVPVQSVAETTLSVSNMGNSDLQLLGITLEGTNPDWFAHNGPNEVIPPGAKLEFQVACSPQQQGPFSAIMRIKSTDLNQPEVTIQLNGSGVAPTAPTPTLTPVTPPPTPTPPVIPPIPTPTPTQAIPVGVLQPMAAYEFDQVDLKANGWKEIPGGLGGAAPGQISPLSFVGPLIPSSKDKVGLIIRVDPTEVAFIHALDAVETGGSPVLMRMIVRADGPGAAVALAALEGSLATGEGLDWSIATHIPGTAASFVQNERSMILLYEPDSTEKVTPIIQVAATGQAGPVNVFVDKLEVYGIDPETSYVGSMFGTVPAEPPLPAPGGIPAPDLAYEFDQADLGANAWREIAGGLGEADPGQISPLSFVGTWIPSSQDKVGLRITVNPKQVAFIHTLDPVETGGLPVLVRMTVRADAPGAAVALAALKGSLVTGEAMDGTIATNIPTNAASFVEGERRIVLVYQPDSPDPVTPIIQVAASGQAGAVNVFVDKLDVFKLRPTDSYLGSIFGSTPGDVPVVPPSPQPTATLPPVELTPTLPPALPTLTPPPVVPTPTPQLPGRRMIEQEPNDAQAQAQNLGPWSPASTIQVTGRMSAGGFQGENYVGDADFYSVVVASRLNVALILDWTDQADLDLLLLSGGQTIDSDTGYEKPAVISRTLEPGMYLLLVISADNASDYTLALTPGGSELRIPAPTPIYGPANTSTPTSIPAYTPTPTSMPAATPPPISGHPFKGTYNIQIRGDDIGSGIMIIDDNGNVSGSTTTPYGTYSIIGTVSLDGVVTFVYEGAGDVVGGGTGTFSGTSASGTWQNILGESGTWTAYRA